MGVHSFEEFTTDKLVRVEATGRPLIPIQFWVGKGGPWVTSWIEIKPIELTFFEKLLGKKNRVRVLYLGANGKQCYRKGRR